MWRKNTKHKKIRRNQLARPGSIEELSTLHAFLAAKCFKWHRKFPAHQPSINININPRDPEVFSVAKYPWQGIAALPIHRHPSGRPHVDDPWPGKFPWNWRKLHRVSPLTEFSHWHRNSHKTVGPILRVQVTASLSNSFLFSLLTPRSLNAFTANFASILGHESMNHMPDLYIYIYGVYIYMRYINLRCKVETDPLWSKFPLCAYTWQASPGAHSFQRWNNGKMAVVFPASPL